MFLIPLFLSLAILYYINYRKNKLNLFQSHGIPTPPTHFLWGNLTIYKSMGSVAFHTHLVSNYGPVVGYYLGTVPYLVVADKELLHTILVSDAQHFITRPRRIPGGVNPDPKRKRMLAHLPPEQWQSVRKTLTGMFNPAKLKPRIPALRRTVDTFLSKLEAIENKSSSNLAPLFESLSLDLIGQTAFGREVNVQDNPKDPLLLAVRDKYAKHMLSPLNILSLCFPEFNRGLYPLRVGWQKVKELLGLGGEKNATLWEVADQCLKESLENPEKEGNTQFHLLQRAGISPELMLAYCVNAFQGDYENVTTTLGFMTQLLIDHPKVQKEIRKELENVRKSRDPNNNSSSTAELAEEDYDFYSQLRYMESVIYETLRLWPQTSFVRRSPSKDYPFDLIIDPVKGTTKRIVIPEGVHIQAAHYLLQRDEGEWGHSAKSFQPQRFYELDGDRKKVSPNFVSYQGFGSGPRHCMGQKFAILILKMIMTRVVERYELKAADDCKHEKREQKFGDSLMTPVTPFYARISTI